MGWGGSDMEPSWANYGTTAGLVKGANVSGRVPYFNFGSADGCPQSGTGGSCNNGWNIGGIGFLSQQGVAFPTPEIYSIPLANQWTVARKHWNQTHASNYVFYGATATTIGLPAQQAWNALRARNSAVVRELILISF
jgi:hypothetical protein